MKRIISLGLFVFTIWSAQAQVSKRIVVEHFTNTYCGICANRNPGFYSNINAQPDVLHLAYHPSSPYPQCPLNQHNDIENDERTDYYNVYGGTPRIVIQGNVIPASANYNDGSLFTQHSQETSAYSIKAELFPTVISTLDLRVVIRYEGGTAIDSAQLFAGLFEDTVVMQSQNGEKDPKNVFRKSFTSTSGNRVALPGQVGDSVVFMYSVSVNQIWKLPAVYSAVLLQEANGALIQAASSRDANGSNPTSILKANEVSDLRLYPNPSAGIIRFNEHFDEGRYVIRDLLGKTVLDGTFQQEIDLSQLPSGWYVLQVREGDFRKTFRIEKR